MKQIIVIPCIVIFLACNIFLIFKNEEKINRTFYIEKWTMAREQNILETMPTKGVFVPKEEQHVYYDRDNGVFNRFLVDKGDQVEPGTNLAEYSAASFNQDKEKLKIEKNKLEREQINLEETIQKLTDMQTEAEFAAFEAGNSHELMNQQLTKDIYEKELQLSKIENEIEKYNALMASIDERLGNLTISSEISGTVKSISQDLTNPIITISSNEQRIEGTLTEAEAKFIKEGMAVFAVPLDTNQRINGYIDKIDKYPLSKPDVEKESQYGFSAVLEEDANNNSLHGARADVKIITAEVKGALTIPAESIKRADNKHYAFIILDNGRLERVRITPGITVNETQEIIKGLQKGERIVYKRPPFARAGFPIITPIEPSQINKDSFANLRKKDMLKMMAAGFLAR